MKNIKKIPVQCLLVLSISLLCAVSTRAAMIAVPPEVQKLPPAEQSRILEEDGKADMKLKMEVGRQRFEERQQAQANVGEQMSRIAAERREELTPKTDNTDDDDDSMLYVLIASFIALLGAACWGFSKMRPSAAVKPNFD